MNKTLFRYAGLLLLSISAALSAQPTSPENKPGNTATPPDFAELAANADVVALVQVWDIDYQYVRDFPNKGVTTVDVLIGYKGLETGEQVDIHEEGLKIENGCYFPDRANEGHRFLTFLRRDEKNKLRGTGPYCRLPVFVTRDHRYALLAPLHGISLPSPDLVHALDFNDPHAFIDVSELSNAQIREIEEEYGAQWRGKRLGLTSDPPADGNGDDSSAWQVPVADTPLPPDDGLIYTQGVYLSDVRRLMFAEDAEETP